MLASANENIIEMPLNGGQDVDEARYTHETSSEHSFSTASECENGSMEEIARVESPDTSSEVIGLYSNSRAMLIMIVGTRE
jgi:hypothetical protein